MMAQRRVPNAPEIPVFTRIRPGPLPPLSETMAEVVANWEAADQRRDDADGLRTYEQVARWLSPDVRAAIEAGLPDGLRRSDDGVRHGTAAGYAQHRARRELSCDPCALANMRHWHQQRHRLDHA